MTDYIKKTALIGSGKKRHVVASIGSRYSAVCGAGENTTGSRYRSSAHDLREFDAYEVTCSRCRAKLEQIDFELSPSHEIAEEIMSEIIDERLERVTDETARQRPNALISQGDGVYKVATVDGELYRITNGEHLFTVTRQSDGKNVASLETLEQCYLYVFRPIAATCAESVYLNGRHGVSVTDKYGEYPVESQAHAIKQARRYPETFVRYAKNRFVVVDLNGYEYDIVITDNLWIAYDGNDERVNSGVSKDDIYRKLSFTVFKAESELTIALVDAQSNGFKNRVNKVIDFVTSVFVYAAKIGIYRRNVERGVELLAENFDGIIERPYGDDVVSRHLIDETVLATARIRNFEIKQAYKRPGSIVSIDDDERYRFVIENRLYSVFLDDSGEPSVYTLFDCECKKYFAREFASPVAARLAVYADIASTRSHNYVVLGGVR